jgi:hypothetical protein
MPIKGISTLYRPARQGKIHLGVKNVKKKSDGTETSYPSEVDYFVMKDAPWLIPFYGPDPVDPKNPDGVHLSINVTLPSARLDRENFAQYLEKVFPQYLKRYKKSGLMCKGDGVLANAVTPEGLKEIECPCAFLDSGECKRMANLRVRIQEMPSFNPIQIDTSSFNSILNINSFIRDLVEHCIVYGLDVSDVKLVLRRQETTTQRLEKGESKTSKHHVMVLDLDPRFYKNLDDVRVRALPQSQSKPIALPPATHPDVEEFYPEEKDEAVVRDRIAMATNAIKDGKAGLDAMKEAAAKVGISIGEKVPETVPVPLTPDQRLAKAVEDFKAVKGILSSAERVRISKLTTADAKNNAAKYFENRTADLQKQKKLAM